MEFSKEKSHLSALEKTEFENNNTKKSDIGKIPGVGIKTKEKMIKQNIHTIDDLVNTISNDFTKLCSITPSSGINNHKIFDALETFMAPKTVELGQKSTNSSHNLQELNKISSCRMQ